jgi:holo-ACP synthase/triphosphoribosyl-dephospho-CoA synthase
MPVRQKGFKPETVSLEEMLDARERRAALREKLRAENRLPLICFTLNISGPVKTFPLALRAFDEGKEIIEGILKTRNAAVLHHTERREKTGPEGFYSVRGDAEELKRLLMAAEASHPLGRLFDMDVFDQEGRGLRGLDYGRPERGCLICGGPVWICSRSGAHQGETLFRRTVEIMEDYFDGQYAGEIAAKAVRALMTEACITPKPGLVDRADTGAHRDMDIFSFINSGCALFPYFREVTLTGIRFTGESRDLLPAIRHQGIAAEKVMLGAAGGVNTHRGAIFSLGILCAVLGYIRGKNLPELEDTLFDLAGETAAGITRELTGGAVSPESHGQAAFRTWGITGARGEAEAGFPSLRHIALPVLRKYRNRGYSTEQAGTAALLHLIAALEDTNIAARSGGESLGIIRSETGRFLEGGPDFPELLEYAQSLNRRFIDRGISPGGSADMLAAALFAASVFDDEENSGQKEGAGIKAGPVRKVIISAE